MRTVLKLTQGTPEWKKHRRHHMNASDAPAMAGVSQYLPRSDFVRMQALGEEREVDAGLQKRFDDGHEYEAIARPWAEEIVGEDLFPIVVRDDIEGLPLSASYDGATMDETVIWEHKTLNMDLAMALDMGHIPECYWPQLEQQLLLLGAERCLFMASNGTRESERHVWYTSRPEVREKIIPGWKQFLADVANYQHVEVLPKASPEPVMGLPALQIETRGEIELVSNLERFGARLRDFIAAVPAKPATDQDFANCEQAVKILKEAEERLEAAESAALSKFASIDEMRQEVLLYRNLARTQRLAIDKLVTARKAAIRDEIRIEHANAYAAHLEALNERLGGDYMPRIEARFAEAMKGKKTVTGLREACNVELTRLRLESSAVADRIERNLKVLAAHAQHRHLFADERTLVLKAHEDFVLAVQARIAQHQAERARELEEERAKIRAEEEARAQAQVAAAAPPAPTPAPAAAPRATVTALPSTRPTDDQIIAALAQHFRVHESKVIEWLLAMDLKSASERMVASL